MIKIGDRINDRYRLLSRIAQGGMAEIYEAQDMSLKRTCAIKFILANLLTDSTNLRRFEREASIGRRLNHPNVVSVYDSGVYEGRPFIVLEFIKGQTLGEKLKLHSYLSYIEICEIMVQLCDALDYIHRRGIVHRDIKPDNIYYAYDGSTKLADFGIALDLNNITQADKSLIGSVHYLAPEICQGQDILPVSDIYSLGITFFELVTHRLPFDSEEPLDVAVSQVKDSLPLPRTLAPDLPSPIEKVILKATMKNPNDRYQNAKEMHADLIDIISNKKKYAKHRSLLEKIFGFKGD